MGLTILIGTLAAFGAFFVGFALMGWLLGSSRGFRLVYFPAADPAAGLFRYRMLRGLGLLTCPLVMADTALSPEEKAWLVKKIPGIRFCSPEELSEMLRQEADSL